MENFPKQKYEEISLFNQKLIASLKILQSINPTFFSSDVLIVGLPGSGKTQLIRRFENLYGEISTDTQETVGTDLMKITYKNQKILIREAGFQVLNTWEKYCRESKIILFLVDSSNYIDIADNLIEFMNLMTYTDKDQRPLGLILNKIDNINALSPLELEDLMELNGLKESRPDLLIHFISALTSLNVESLLNWIVKILQLSNKEIPKKSIKKSGSCLRF